MSRDVGFNNNELVAALGASCLDLQNDSRVVTDSLTSGRCAEAPKKEK